MKRAIATIIVFIAVFSLSACGNSCAEGHTWTYSVPENKKVCSVCGEEEAYSPSGHYISSEMLAVAPWFNENQIACAYSESVFDDFNRNRSEERAKELIESGELFYVKPGETCDFVDDRDWTSPQNHIVITSGDMNGTECWTLTYAIASQEELDEFYTSIRIDEESASQTTVKNIPLDFSDSEKIHSLVDQATQIINETGNPINSDGSFDYEKHSKLREVLAMLFPYLGNDECDQLIMRDEMLTNLIIGMDNWGYFRTDTGESVVFIAKQAFLPGAGTMGLNVAVQTNDSFYSGTYYRISNSGLITDTNGNVAGSIEFDSPDVITFTTKDGSVYTMNRIAKYSGLDPKVQISSAITEATEAISVIGSPIKSDEQIDREKYESLSSAFQNLYPYRGINECQALLMSDEFLINRLLGSNIDEAGRFETEDGTGYAEFRSGYGSYGNNLSIRVNISLKDPEVWVSEDIYRIDKNDQLYYTTFLPSNYNIVYKNVVAGVHFNDVDTLTINIPGESTPYVLHRVIKNEIESTESTTGDNSSQAESPSENTTNEYVGFFEGTYVVGTDIPAGTYRLVSLYPEYSAYWERTTDASGETSAIIANDNFSGTTYVTVQNGEYFTVKRCSAALQ